MPRNNHGYKIYKKYTIKEVFDLLKENKIPDELIFHVKDMSDSLKRANIIKSLIDRDGLKCQYCNKIPEYFASAKDNAGRWHLDLYSDDNGEPYMYTIDHIYPKSKGGKNELENYQLLCKPCNEIKGDKVDGEEPKPKPINKSKYINKKLESLSQQIKGILLKLKNHKLVCIKCQKNFTLDKEYSIIDINVKIDNDFNTKYLIYLKDDNGKIVRTTFDNFITKIDYDNYYKQ